MSFCQRAVVIASLVLVAVSGVNDVGRLKAQGAQVFDQTLQVSGLQRPAQILVDRWGVPHIYAQSIDDAFFVQGVNAARDRLFQIDLWRRRGLGLLAEVLGPGYVDQDRAARLFVYRGNMNVEWAAYGPDARRMATAFVAGINSYFWIGDLARYIGICESIFHHEWFTANGYLTGNSPARF